MAGPRLEVWVSRDFKAFTLGYVWVEYLLLAAFVRGFGLLRWFVLVDCASIFWIVSNLASRH